MNAADIRNLIASGLSEYLGVPVVRSGQTAPETEPPYCVYSVTAQYIRDGSFGNYALAERGHDILSTRTEQPSMTLSLTFCSVTGWRGEAYVHGDDEALDLCQRAMGWFSHAAYADLSLRGVVVADLMNPGNRQALQVDEEANRYGFDVRLRFTQSVTRVDCAIEKVKYGL